jgi:FSR family fosmidomycin resistance protein-like MFS transporter
MPWRCALYGLRHFGIAVALAVALLLPESDHTHRSETSKERPRYADKSRGDFSLLFAICVLDSAARMGFLPFLLEAKGTSLPEIGFALALVFIGGAAGKFACGSLGARLGTAILTLPLIRR